MFYVVIDFIRVVTLLFDVIPTSISARRLYSK